MPRWWENDPKEKYWIEIRKRDGLGLSLECPDRDADGGIDPWYELVHEVGAGEVIYHWNALEHRFVGRSVAEADAQYNQTGDGYTVQLSQFQTIVARVGLDELRAMADDLYAVRDRLKAMHGNPLYLPFQFKKDRTRLSLMSNYFAKLPADLVSPLFGDDGLALAELPEVWANAEDDHDSAPASRRAPDTGGRIYLNPFKGSQPIPM